MKKLLFITILLLSCQMVFSQGYALKSVYLKSGNIVKGIIIEEVPNQLIKVKTPGGSLFVFKIDEIEKIVLDTQTVREEKATLPQPQTAIVSQQLPDEKTDEISSLQQKNNTDSLSVYQSVTLLTDKQLFEIGKNKYEAKNYEEAAKYYYQSALQGYSEAQYQLGLMYESGIGVPQSRREAKKWFTNAANKGHKEAYRKLYTLYF